MYVFRDKVWWEGGKEGDYKEKRPLKRRKEKEREDFGDIVGANNEIYIEERRQFEGGGCDVYLLVVFLTNIGF